MSENLNVYVKNLIEILDKPFAPKYLYKYLNIEGGKIALEKNTLKFSKPTSFEDITECRSLRLNTDIKDFSDRADFFSKFQLKHTDDITTISRKINGGNIDFASAIDENLINKFGISCLSEIPNNDYLWGYEAIKHNGICIEYDAVFLRDFLRRNLKVENSFHLCHRAVYLENIEKVNFNINEDIIITVLNWFFVKRVNPYSQEHEVRIISSFDHEERECSFVCLPDIVLKKVYVGKNVLDADFFMIQNIVKGKYPKTVNVIRQ
jgi:hypothetical protein